MVTKHFILATAGHVDHGKSALVKALTGTNPDRLPEEKARGITIELGFANLLLRRPNEEFHVGIIDVPGHEDFVRNMVAGLSAVDLALLAVAADDGWMPQTEEHLQILEYANVRRAVIALTKSDLGDVEKTSASIREKLRGTSFAESPIIATSTRSGASIAELKETLAQEFSLINPQRDIGKPRLFVDRAFALHGIGTVVTGTLTGGTLRRGDAVTVRPRNISSRVRGIQSHNQELSAAGPATRVALNLADVTLGNENSAVRRGDIVTLANPSAAASTLNVLLVRSTRLQPKTAAARPIKNGSQVQVHVGSARLPARLFLFDGETVERGTSAIAQLRFESPIFAFVGDCFVARDASEQNTIAGGIVLDADADRKSFRSLAQREFFQQRSQSPDNLLVLLATEFARDHLTTRASVLTKSHFSAEEIAEGIQRLVESKTVAERGEIVADATRWQNIFQHAAEMIDAHHRSHPAERGLDLSELRREFSDQAEEVIDALLQELCERGFARSGNRIGTATHRVVLPAHLQTPAAKMRAALASKSFDPPSRKELAPDAISRQVLRFLLETGDVLELSDEVVISNESFACMKAAIEKFLRENGEASVSELRQMLESSRRVVVPLLERLDREGVTRRVGDKRVLARNGA
jgi:selenocysteine-specific elongation factor